MEKDKNRNFQSTNKAFMFEKNVKKYYALNNGYLN
jgi:hypothetical protein